MIEGTSVSGRLGDLTGTLVLTENGNGSGVLSATFFSPGLEDATHISKIVPESEQILEYSGLLAAVARAGFEVEGNLVG